MSQSGVYKGLLKSRPHGMPKTPFNVREGRHLSLSDRSLFRRIAVKSKVPETDRLYYCNVLDPQVEIDSEIIEASHLSGSTDVEVETGALAIAHKMEDGWWFMYGEEVLVPTIDFMVENFDRVDADDLGSLWSNGQKWAIRNQKAYEAGTGATEYLYQVALFYNRFTADGEPSVNRAVTSSYPEITGSEYHPKVYLGEGTLMFTPGFVGYVADVIYKAALSNGDHNIKVISNASHLESFEHVTGEYGSIPNNGYSTTFEVCLNIPPLNQARGTRVSIAAAMHEGMSSPGGTAYVNAVFTCEHGGTTDTAEAAAGDSDAAKQFARIKILSNDGSGDRFILNATFDDSVDDLSPNDPAEQCNGFVHHPGIYCSARRNYYKMTGVGNIGLQASYNTFYFQVRSGFVSLWINGTSVFSDEYMYTQDAGMFGLRGAANLLSRYLDGFGDCHINQIKVWAVDIPEPSGAESGHGKWSLEEGFTYTDKYHDGDTYDPNA